METLKSVDALYKYLNERPVGTLAYRHLTGPQLGDEIQQGLQKDCEMDMDLVRKCVEDKGWEFEPFPELGGPPHFVIIRAGETTITAYIAPQELTHAEALTPTAKTSKWRRTINAVKRLLLG